jgi:hypothetical protein
MRLGHWSNNKSRANHQSKEKFFRKRNTNQPAAIVYEEKVLFKFFLLLVGNDPHHKLSVTSRRMCFSLSLSLCPQTKQRAKVDLSLETFWFFDSCK